MTYSEKESKELFVLLLLTNGVRTAKPVEQIPRVLLQCWSVFEVVIKTEPVNFLVGWNATEHTGRVSTGIGEFTASTRTCKTESGRVYELDGPPGRDPTGLYVWEMTRGDFDYRDVTQNFWQQMLKA